MTLRVKNGNAVCTQAILGYFHRIKEEHGDKMMKSIMSVMSVLVVVFGMSVFSAKAESQYNIFAYWVRGPVRTNQISSPAYDAWSTNVVWKLYNNQTLADEDVGYRLRTEYVTQPAGELNSNTLHLVVRITGKTGAKVALNQLRFVGWSSDPANTMSNVYNLTTVSNLIYSRRALGINYALGGARVSDEIDTIGDAAQQKNEIVFVGMQCKYYPFGSSANLTQIDQYLNHFTVNFELTGSCEIWNGEEMLGVAHRTLQVKNSPIQPRLSISGESENIRLGINMEPRRTAVVFSRPAVDRGPWRLEGTFNTGETFLRPSSEPARFYRAELE